MPIVSSVRVELPLPRITGATECESMGGKPAAAARQSVGSMPARAESVANQSHAALERFPG